LSARLCGSNDFALRSGSGFFCGGHRVSLSIRILQHEYMSAEDHTASDCCKKSSRE
jgi:hypothetical protein